MPVDPSLVGREFPAPASLTVTAERVSAFAAAVGHPQSPGEPLPPTFPIVLAFGAMQAFLDAERIDLHRIVHGEQRFAYVRPPEVGDELTATLTVTGLRQIGGADIIATTSEITDETGAVVCTGKATLVHSAAPGGAA
ncbi:MaoC family dehydratase N-terminal domain-containing protein [Nocardioides sp. SYSU D00065]|uniref:FAS1-like dehydratase domain-containing protein n=1 Tax=Nocardioides sp. SYSU D00065 TaxID=2817378 RepID=UPI001B336BD2|nr:MaoC family dehydratase N-terminal domain-containing protein [Nocardioides sp. SYSU D00065]